MEEIEDLRARFEDLIAFVQNAAANLDKDCAIDTADLSIKAAQLCEAVENSKPKTANKLKPIMAELIEELDGLALKLGKMKEGSH